MAKFKVLALYGRMKSVHTNQKASSTETIGKDNATPYSFFERCLKH